MQRWSQPPVTRYPNPTKLHYSCPSWGPGCPFGPCVTHPFLLFSQLMLSLTASSSLRMSLGAGTDLRRCTHLLNRCERPSPLALERKCVSGGIFAQIRRLPLPMDDQTTRFDITLSKSSYIVAMATILACMFIRCAGATNAILGCMTLQTLAGSRRQFDLPLTFLLSGQVRELSIRASALASSIMMLLLPLKSLEPRLI